jgi:hypothetical protein
MKPPLVLNQSSLKDYLNCQRLYGWNRLEHLEALGRRSALEIGTAVHAGLAVLHAEDPVGVATTLLSELESPKTGQYKLEPGTATETAKSLEHIPTTPVAAAVRVARATLAKRAGPGSAFDDKSLPEADEITTRVLTAYNEHWKHQGKMWTPINQEIEFLVEVGTGTNIWIRGRLDNLSVYIGALWLVDYKTAGKMDPRDLLKYEMDIQLSTYIYGLSKQLTQESVAAGGEPIRIEGAIIDLLVKTAVPQFAREQYTRTEEELAEFEREFLEYANRIREQIARVRDGGEDWKTVFPKNTEHCFRYGTCPFRDLCLKDTPVRRALYNKRAADYVDDAQKDLDAKYAAAIAKESGL